MKILVHRFEYSTKYTIGRLYIDDVYQCFTLEDMVRVSGIKIPHETAIPAGTYKVSIDFSEHFQKEMLHILDVPQFEGIRIHAGNSDADTEGCILVGTSWSGTDLLVNSKTALLLITPKIKAALACDEEVTITIEDTKWSITY